MIYFLFALIGAAVMHAIWIIIFVRDKKIHDKMHFYIFKVNSQSNSFILFMGKSLRWNNYFKNVITVNNNEDAKFWGLNLEDYKDMEVREIREVFPNLENNKKLEL